MLTLVLFAQSQNRRQIRQTITDYDSLTMTQIQKKNRRQIRQTITDYDFLTMTQIQKKNRRLIQQLSQTATP